MTVLALPSPPCPLTGMLGGAGECPGLRTASRQPPLSPVGQEPSLPQPVTQPLPPVRVLVGIHWHLLGFVPLLPERKMLLLSPPTWPP